MRLGHKSSCRLQVGLEADSQIVAVLEAMEQRQLVDQHSAQDKALGRDKPSCWDLAETVEDGLELGVEVLYGVRAQLMEDATDLDAVVGVRVLAPFGSNQQPSLGLAQFEQFGVVVLDIPQDDSDVGGQLVQQGRSLGVVPSVGGGEASGQGDPDGGDRGDEVEFPAVDPAMLDELVQPASVSMELCGTTPASRCFLCQTPPWAARAALSMAAAGP